MSEILEIEIPKSDSKAFYKQVINVSNQIVKLKKNPNGKIRDDFKDYKMLSVFLLILEVLFIIDIVTNHATNLTTFIAGVLLFGFLFSIIISINLSKILMRHIENASDALLILDSDGVELNREGFYSIKKAWGSIQFIGVYGGLICLVPKEDTGIIICIDRKYFDQIRNYIQNCDINVQVISH